MNVPQILIKVKKRNFLWCCIFLIDSTEASKSESSSGLVIGIVAVVVVVGVVAAVVVMKKRTKQPGQGRAGATEEVPATASVALTASEAPSAVGKDTVKVERSPSTTDADTGSSRSKVSNRSQGSSRSKTSNRNAPEV